jgi:hypothetical protein
MTARFIGARLDDEAVLLDISTHSVIHLDANALRVLDQFVSGTRNSGIPDPSAAQDETEVPAVCAALDRAGILRRVDGRYTLGAPIEWS